ncbi:MAG: F0F1 ATP synthase subunit epsilon [Acidobacteria bacterium]|nr:MAG: F0F1 ATP synthase subunit epsilon [Acidobacteriota bacterium]
MLPEALELVIVTPTRQLVRTRTREVTLPGANGYLGVLPGHAPLMTELGVGELTFQAAQAERLSLIRGFAEVLPDRVTVLAETAELAAEIDLERAEAAKARAEQRLAEKDPNIDWDRVSVALQRALIRIQVARKHRGVPVNAH